MKRQCRKCGESYESCRQGIEDFCCVDCMIEWYADKLLLTTYAVNCSPEIRAEVESVVEEIIDVAFYSGYQTDDI